ncbi:hypothetical protein KRX51_08975 [Corynebacterium sp. TAE3-ERU12]|uniref:hypothetical protein n=1 Tax=Corynebacterium sp. TAE3-ERU12 TaxID=2849491 RepID=UPI001C444036|nr:hypothetical protein [Corynebacterium sp. TAE3-ERU12]MBV7296041.1 hypothetical protein [Corynebacterium sp. TAE3-ERU12]
MRLLAACVAFAALAAPPGHHVRAGRFELSAVVASASTVALVLVLAAAPASES